MVVHRVLVIMSNLKLCGGLSAGGRALGGGPLKTLAVSQCQ